MKLVRPNAFARPRRRQPPKFSRRGLAPLEFVMLLPIWVLFLCLILHVAEGGINAIRTTNQTRFETWKQRDDKALPDLDPMVWKPGGQQGEALARSDYDVRTGTIFDRWKNRFVSEQSLYANAWANDSFDESGYSFAPSKSMNSQQMYYGQINGSLTRFGAPDFPKARSAAVAQNIPNK